MTAVRPLVVSCLLVVACFVAACGGGAAEPDADPPPATPSPSSPTSAASSAAPAGGSIDGTFDVGGHRLYLTCEGTGSPTIIYLHGAITEATIVPHQNAGAIGNALSGTYRVCRYDRRNLGRSEKVDAVQRPKDVLDDVHRLLAAAEVGPPYVLLGASFGGLVAYLYANTYPDEVFGMVLLDSMFPDELKLEHLIDPKERYVAYDTEDENGSLERISHYKMLNAAQRYVGKEPAIPVTYLASIPEGFDKDDLGDKYNSKILGVQEAYVDRFRPGKLIRVDVPHFMEPKIPDRIAQELRDVIAAAGQR